MTTGQAGGITLVIARFDLARLIQYPLYGIILAVANQKAKTRLAAIGLGGLHVLMATLNLVIPNQNFS